MSDWWRDALVYQVYPRSFADADGDGMGDLPGITARLSHLVELGVDALWLSPFYLSPQHDAGYDVADYFAVDPRFGTLDDFDELIAAAHADDVRVIVDIVPNHSSWDHADFRAALAAAPGSPEREKYLFRDGKGENGELPPNNWQSVFHGDAWSRVTAAGGTPGQWYLHSFDESQPDWNWENPVVRADFETVLRFWLDRGVDGFRVDVAHGMAKAPGLPDVETNVEGLLNFDTEKPSPMWDQDAVHDIYRDWRRVLDSYDDRMMVGEAWVAADRLALYVRGDEMHQAFNFAFLKAEWSGASIRDTIAGSLREALTVGAPTTWVLSNHDTIRHATRYGYGSSEQTPMGEGIGATDPQPDRELGLRRARAATMLMLTLPGSAYLYQGEEFGLPEVTDLPDDKREDPAHLRSGGQVAGRDGCRVPLPWEAGETNFGFGRSGTPWLPQPDYFAGYACDAEDGVPTSTLELYRAAVAIRKDRGLGSGQIEWLDGFDDAVVALRNGDLAVLVNTGPDAIDLPDGADVVLASGPLTSDGQGLPGDTAVYLRR